MENNPVTRTTLAIHELTQSINISHVEVRRITMAPNLVAGPHKHNGPVFGFIERGSAYVQIEDKETQRLSAGEIFYEPENLTISKFDATEEGVTFLGWFPLDDNNQPEIEML